MAEVALLTHRLGSGKAELSAAVAPPLTAGAFTASFWQVEFNMKHEPLPGDRRA